MQNSDVSPSVAVSSLGDSILAAAAREFRSLSALSHETHEALRNFEILSLATGHDKTNDKFARRTYIHTHAMHRVHARARCAFMRE